MNDERRILDMLASGQINVDEATELLDAVKRSKPPEPPTAPKPPKGVARMLRIRVDAEEDDGTHKAKVDVNVPLGLAKFATKFLPDNAREHLENRGMNLAELFESIDGDFPEGNIINIDTSEDDDSHKAKITVEVT